jgi:hypothetical protein
MPHLSVEDYYIAPVSQADALRLIRKHHYAGNGPNTASYRHGLFRVKKNKLVGVALWLPPPPQGAKSAAIDLGLDNWHTVLSLSRLVIKPSVPTNGASFLIGRSMRLIKQEGRYKGLLTFADEYQEHTGAIYKATNWTYTGLTKPYWTWVDRAGVLVSKKMGPTNRSVSEMQALGYSKLGPFRKHRFIKHV